MPDDPVSSREQLECSPLGREALFVFCFCLLGCNASATARVISRRWNDDDEISFLLEETGVPGGNHRPTASNWEALYAYTDSAGPHKLYIETTPGTHRHANPDGHFFHTDMRFDRKGASAYKLCRYHIISIFNISGGKRYENAPNYNWPTTLIWGGGASRPLFLHHSPLLCKWGKLNHYVHRPDTEGVGLHYKVGSVWLAHRALGGQRNFFSWTFGG